MSTKDTLTNLGLLVAGGAAIAAAAAGVGKGSRAVALPPRGPYLKIDVVPMTFKEAMSEGYVDRGYERPKERGLRDDHVGYYISEMAFSDPLTQWDWNSGWYIDLNDYREDHAQRDPLDEPEGMSWATWEAVEKSAEDLFKNLTKVKVGTAFYFNESGFLGTTRASY